MNHSRRKFLKNMFSVYSTTLLAPNLFANNIDKSKLDIGLQMYSFAPLIMQGKFDLLGFPDLVKNTYGINGAEYWSIPFMGRENDRDFLNDLKRRSDDNGVDNLIILVDDIDIKTMQSGPSLASSNKNDRDTAIDYHKKWIDVAKEIGCHSIRVNLKSDESDNKKILDNSSESISRLIEFSKQDNISIVIENHGGITADADWLVSLIKNVDNKYVGTLPDFGDYNFCVDRGALNFDDIGKVCENQYDKYLGVKKLMPYAKGVSAKSHEFDKDGEELSTNYSRMIKIISESNYKGYITIEYEGAMMGMFGGEGTYLNPHDGILATKKLINKYL
ncbi:MAG: TIM barrel protein [Cytophagales bacterium]|nr:TIM barrel protein [Cytophagales bacterium]